MNAVVSVAHAFKLDAFMLAAQEKFQSNFGEFGSDAKSFCEQIWGDALTDDMEGISLSDSMALAAEFWSYGELRKGDDVLVRIRPAKGSDNQDLGRDILEIIGQDRPFLVDSLMSEISANSLDILAMFHPIVATRRDKQGKRTDTGGRCLNESMIQIQIERLSKGERDQLIEDIETTLNDVHDSVEDWVDMRAQMDDAIDHISKANTSCSREELDEAIAFLKWLRDDHFTFLGCRVYSFQLDKNHNLIKSDDNILVASGRGVLRDPDRHVLRDSAEPILLTPAIQSYLQTPSPVIVAKSNMKSRVHRRVYMDYIGVKRYRDDGVVIGEARFVGLFTAEAYDEMTRDVPLIRRRVRQVLEKAAKTPGSHSAKRLQNIVENYPRDELFQTEEDDLLQISLGILHLIDRPRVKLFMRRDQFDRFVSCQLFVPRDRYNSRLREEAGELIRSAFNGRLSAFYPSFGDSPLARVHFIIGLDPFNHPEPDPHELESQIVTLARTWEDELSSVARELSLPKLHKAIPAYIKGFTAGYRERFSPKAALFDIERMERLSSKGLTLTAKAERLSSDDPGHVRIKLYRLGEPAHLSEVMPVLENLGLNVLAEAGYEIHRSKGKTATESIWVHEFLARLSDDLADCFSDRALAFEEALLAILSNQTEDDGFNKLVLHIGVSWRDVSFLRACARYRQQSGLDPSQNIQENALIAYPDVARALLDLAQKRFDPTLKLSAGDRESQSETIGEAIRQSLDAVESLDHDRALRRILRFIESVLRTNFYQTDEKGEAKPWISLKIDSGNIRALPDPKPYREIFVWSPRVEGVHIRFGPVARGGLRWSDRREDFRTEVLGLVKAQQVKNSVIVPVGSKGGFYPKQLPDRSSRDAFFNEGKEAYKIFLRGMLDITDNIVNERLVRPDNVVCWDNEDPYLVVAADKGTATFSDTANDVATQEYDFWLGDAFASGGSAGYDHKKMGITARGAWVSVQRHFREMGKDIQNEDFTVLGVGDMSGDVFGNGMLLSRKIRLQAAFDHRDIFIDPNPRDTQASFEERERIFKLPRSSWKDYDESLISKGGGIFSRTAKSIILTDEIRALINVEDKALPPNELIKALLRTKMELLWFGGIGTYIKAGYEQNWEVGDKANDSLRINADELGALVVGEGANLGMTQAARIEFNSGSGRVNADFVDNSAGVDSSDHEVNIKILLNSMVQDKTMTLKSRNTLLEDMTDNVADHVLKHNYDQTLALTIAMEHAAEDLDAHERMMERLEAAGRLDRKVEGLPNSEKIRELKAQGLGMRRPEIAVLLSYAKITLFDKLVGSSVPDDPHFSDMLVTYFPEQLADKAQAMQNHRLKREIIATRLANDIVNLGGPTFVHRARESTGTDAEVIARAFEAGRTLFRFSDLTDRINALDNKAPASVQTALHDEVIRLLRRQTYWLARRSLDQNWTSIDEVINNYQSGVDALKIVINDVVSDYDRSVSKARATKFIESGAPQNLAEDVSRLRPLNSSTDVIDLSHRVDGWPVVSTSWLYHAVGARFGIDKLRGASSQLSSSEHWDRLAMRRLVEDLYASQLAISELVMNYTRQAGGMLTAGIEEPDKGWADDAVFSWISAHALEVDRIDSTFEDIIATGAWTLSKIAICSTQLRELAATGPKI